MDRLDEDIHQVQMEKHRQWMNDMASNIGSLPPALDYQARLKDTIARIERAHIIDISENVIVMKARRRNAKPSVAPGHTATLFTFRKDQRC